MRTHASGLTFAELTKLVNVAFGKQYRANQVKCACYDRSIKNGLSGGRPKGTGLGNKWGFSKGNRPHNYLPVGTERSDKYGLTRIKVSDKPAVWRYKHAVLWTEAHGQVPAGHNVIFADGNKQNFSLDNLVLVTNAELAYLNRKGLIYGDTDLTKTAVVLTKLQLRINEKVRESGSLTVGLPGTDKRDFT
jgi:hypothetical protein